MTPDPLGWLIDVGILIFAGSLALDWWERRKWRKEDRR